jgi:membrane protease YdiL (CAAX protease family)
MPLFALTLSRDLREELQNGVRGLFILFILVSFVCVAFYTAKQIRTGRLFGKETEPLSLGMTALSGWIFIASVVGLIYLQSPLYAIVVLVGTAGVLAENRRSSMRQFGLDLVTPRRAFIWGLLIFGMVMMVEIPLAGASNWALDFYDVPHPEQQSVETFRQYDQTSVILLFLFQAVLFFPIIEELFFRGFLLTFLKNYTSTWMAIVLSGGVFAFAHLNLGAAIPLWFLGIVLGVAYEHTGSLLVPISVHACFNLAEGLSLLMDKGSAS